MIQYGTLWDMQDRPMRVCMVQCAIACAFHEILPEDQKREAIIFLPRLIGAEDWEVVDERYQKMGNDIAFVYVPMLCSFAHAIWPNVPLKAMVGRTKLEIGSNCSAAGEVCNQLGLVEVAKGFDAAYFATCNGFDERTPWFDIYMSLRFPSNVLRAIGQIIERQPPATQPWCYASLRKAMRSTMTGLFSIGKRSDIYSLKPEEADKAFVTLRGAMRDTYTWNS